MATTRMRDDGIVGNFGTPDGAGPFPGVLALGGSDGGTPDYFLNLLVPEGFACLALQYLGHERDAVGVQRDPVGADRDGP